MVVAVWLRMDSRDGERERRREMDHATLGSSYQALLERSQHPCALSQVAVWWLARSEWGSVGSANLQARFEASPVRSSTGLAREKGHAASDASCVVELLAEHGNRRRFGRMEGVGRSEVAERSAAWLVQVNGSRSTAPALAVSV